MQPDGKIIKYVSGVGRDEFIIGDYTNGEVGRDNYLFPDLYQKCLEKECPFLPVCHTGCRFDAFFY